MSARNFRQRLLLPASECAEVFGVPLVGRGIVGVELQRFLELRFTPGKIPVVAHLVTTQNGMRMREGRVQLHGPAGSRIGFRIEFAGINPKKRYYRIGVGKPGVGQSVSGVFGDGLIEIGDGGPQVRKRPLVPGVAPFQIQRVSLRIPGALIDDLLPSCRAERGPQLSCNVARDLLLQRDEVGVLAGVAVSPDFGVVPNVGKLRADFDGVPPKHYSPADYAGSSE